MSNRFLLNNVETLFIWMIALYICEVVFPWRDGLTDGFFSHQRFLQTFLLLASFVFLTLVSLKYVAGAILAPIRVAACFLYAGGLFSVVLAISSIQAYLEFLHWLLLGYLFVCCASIQLKKINIYLLGGTFLFSHGALVFLSILYLSFALANGDPLDASVIYPGAENIRFFNQVQVFILPLLALLLKHPRFSIPAFIFFVANVLLLCIGGARGAALAVLVTLGLMAVGMPIYRQAMIRALVAALIAVVIYLFLWWLGADGLRDISRSGSSGRMGMWIEILQGLKWHNLLWGIGPANYVLFSQKYMFGHPHNSVLQWVLEWGGISFLGAAIIVGKILHAAVKHLKRKPEDMQTLGLLSAWFAALIYSLVDGVIVMPISQTLFVGFAGLLWGRVCNKEVPRFDNVVIESQHGSWRLTIMRGVMILSLSVPYVYLASQYYIQQSSYGSDIKGPRFWINGVPLQVPR